MTLDTLNSLSEAQAAKAFHDCCAAERWVAGMVKGRPYTDVETLERQADRAWSMLDEEDYLQAFAAHPRIGDIEALRASFSAAHRLAAAEQAAVVHADDEVLQWLAEGNAAYEAKFGFIFVVCANGKSAAQMLALLEGRLVNNRDQELQNAAEEQRKINQIRLKKLLSKTEGDVA